jgi:hypothetical protein
MVGFFATINCFAIILRPETEGTIRARLSIWSEKSNAASDGESWCNIGLSIDSNEVGRMKFLTIYSAFVNCVTTINPAVNYTAPFRLIPFITEASNVLVILQLHERPYLAN